MSNSIVGSVLLNPFSLWYFQASVKELLISEKYNFDYWDSLGAVTNYADVSQC